MEKHKIAFAIHAIGEGGAERVTTILCTRFAEKGYEVHLITNHQRDWEYPVSSMVKRHIIGENVSSFRPLASYQRISRLRNICKKEKYDVILAFMSMNEYSVFATAGLRTKNIISLRNAVEKLYPSKLKRSIFIELLSLASGAVFQTEEAMSWFPKRFQEKSTIIFNPVWSQFYQVKREVEPGLMVASGRLVPQKNYSMMLRAFALVASEYDVRLEIYGNGAEKGRLEKIVEKLEISDKVKFCGQSNDVPSVLARADIFLMTSDFEGLPNSLMEAMAVGVPCVCTDCLGGGPRFLLGNSERGLLVRMNDELLFADAIMHYLNSESTKNNKAEAARAYAKRFSVDNCFDAWENYVLNVINNK